MENNKKEINIIVQIILGLIIARHAMSMINNIMVFSLLNDIFFLGVNLSLSVLVIISLALIMMQKKSGVYLFVALQLVSIVFNSIMDSDPITHLLVALVMCVVMFLILQIRKDGISAWKVIMNKEANSDERTTV